MQILPSAAAHLRGDGVHDVPRRPAALLGKAPDGIGQLLGRQVRQHVGQQVGRHQPTAHRLGEELHGAPQADARSTPCWRATARAAARLLSQSCAPALRQSLIEIPVPRARTPLTLHLLDSVLRAALRARAALGGSVSAGPTEGALSPDWSSAEGHEDAAPHQWRRLVELAEALRLRLAGCVRVRLQGGPRTARAAPPPRRWRGEAAHERPARDRPPSGCARTPLGVTALLRNPPPRGNAITGRSRAGPWSDWRRGGGRT